jgi:hypothetical protein
VKEKMHQPTGKKNRYPNKSNESFGECLLIPLFNPVRRSAFSSTHQGKPTNSTREWIIVKLLECLPVAPACPSVKGKGDFGMSPFFGQVSGELIRLPMH